MNASQTVLATALAGMIGSAPAPAPLPLEGNAPPFSGATQWINSPPLTQAALRGKVVVVEFWTFSCINVLRTLPYLRAWSETYEQQGLVVIGVHAPEFGFEADAVNVRRAVRELHISYPVAMDDSFTIWRAFKNEYWPALYFIDAQGHIRHQQFGEGDYAESEAVIRELLLEAGAAHIPAGRARIAASGIEAPADWTALRSPESYVGYERAQNFASPAGAVPDTPARYTAPTQLGLNHWALFGIWTIAKNEIISNAARAHITYRFHARDLHLVMGPGERRTPIRFRVLVDGRPPGDAHGVDIDADGYGVITEPRLYQLVRQHEPIAGRTFDIEFLDANAVAYVFTFG